MANRTARTPRIARTATSGNKTARSTPRTTKTLPTAKKTSKGNGTT